MCVFQNERRAGHQIRAAEVTDGAQLPVRERIVGCKRGRGGGAAAQVMPIKAVLVNGPRA